MSKFVIIGLLICFYSTLIEASKQRSKHKDKSSFKDVHKNRQYHKEKDNVQIEVNLEHFNLNQDVTTNQKSTLTIPSIVEPPILCNGILCKTNETCYYNECVTNCLSGCPNDKTCYNDKCLNKCNDDSQCNVNQTCYDNYVCLESCTSYQECIPTESCYLDVCTLLCNNNSDCENDQYCYEHICTNSCNQDSQCQSTYYCNSGKCTFGCNNDINCKSNQLCVKGYCYDKCINDSQCVDGLYCYQSVCSPACVLDNDCGPDHFCFNGKCITLCQNDLDCSPGDICNDLDYKCTTHYCSRKTCNNDNDCDTECRIFCGEGYCMSYNNFINIECNVCCQSALNDWTYFYNRFTDEVSRQFYHQQCLDFVQMCQGEILTCDCKFFPWTDPCKYPPS